MNATPSLSITIDGIHTLNITLPDKESAKVIANRLAVLGAGSLEGISQSDSDSINSFYENIVTDIDND